ncbi:MAG TPA: TolC family protein [Kofleriaceae bacterium]|nr:TolC family protein [Kofleriaceae bacterium]
MKLCPAVVLVALTACQLRQPNVAPPRPPRMFLTSVDAKDVDNESAPSGSTEHVTPPSETWWSAFADPLLDQSIQEAFHNNYLIRDTRGLIYENMLVPEVPQGWWWPLQIGILAPAGIQHIYANLIGPPGNPLEYNATNVDLTANYQLDLFGNLAAQRSVGINLAEQQRQLVEARVQDTAVQVAQIWFDILQARALRELTLQQIKYNQELYDLVKSRFEQHLTTRLVVLQQEQLLLNLQSQVPLITARIALFNSQLKLTLGRTPTPIDDLIPQDRRLPDLPPPPSIGSPADLNASAPELRVAKLKVEEIQHRMSQHISSWLPTINLTASAGISAIATHVRDFGSTTTRADGTIDTSRSGPFYKESVIGVSLTWPIFDGKHITEGKQLPLTLHRRELQYDLAMKTVVGRVQDAMINETNQATSLTNLRAQVELGGKVLDEARRLFEQGQSDYLSVLTALNSLVDLQRAALLAQRLLLNDRVELYRSLGGNWSYNVTTLQER